METGEDTSMLCSFLEALRQPNEEKSQELRKKHLDIFKSVKRLADEAGEGGCATDELKFFLADLNEAFRNVQGTPEARFDIQILKHVSILGRASIEKSKSSLLTFRPADYADNIVKYLTNDEALSEIFQPDSNSLKSLSEEMAGLYCSTSGCEPLYGALEWKPAENRSARASQRESIKRDVVKKTIQKVDTSSTNVENQTEEVTRIFSVLKKRYADNDSQPIPLLEFVIDPTCFSTTVQNLFHTSFLMRDNEADVCFDENKIPCLKPVPKKERERRRALGHQQNRQAALDMNTDLWLESIKVFGITRPMIPRVASSARRTHSD